MNLGDVSEQATQMSELEKQTIQIFQDAFGKDWECCYHPDFNGLRPTCLFIHPDHGVAVVDVFDWTCEADAITGECPFDRLEKMQKFLQEELVNNTGEEVSDQYLHDAFMSMVVFPSLDSSNVYEMVLQDMAKVYRLSIGMVVRKILGADKLNIPHIRALIADHLSGDNASGAKEYGMFHPTA